MIGIKDLANFEELDQLIDINEIEKIRHDIKQKLHLKIEELIHEEKLE